MTTIFISSQLIPLQPLTPPVFFSPLKLMTVSSVIIIMNMMKSCPLGT